MAHVLAVSVGTGSVSGGLLVTYPEINAVRHSFLLWPAVHRSSARPPAGLLFAGVLVMLAGIACTTERFWRSPNQYRLMLEVDTDGHERSNSPASVEVDFANLLADAGEAGTFDEHTIEVMAYDESGKLRAFDASRSGYEKHLLPWRIEKLYGVNRVTLHFVMPDHHCRRYAVYFDTVESGRGKPERYPGLVGDGDLFTEGYGRSVVGASKMGAFCDLDNDGDLDLFKVTTEPFIYCYENVGNNRYVDQGRLTSGGELFVLPHDGFNRSWATLAFDDWDSDGDQDLFVGLTVGPSGEYREQFVAYENVTSPGKSFTFTERGALNTAQGNKLGSPWFGCMKVADWDGDGVKDILASYQAPKGERRLNEFHFVRFYKNLSSSDPWAFNLAEGEALEAGGKVIDIHSPDVECADIDGDGDLDLFATTQGSRAYFYENTGTRTKPVLAEAREIERIDENGAKGGGHTGITVADFTGDGLPDCMIGHLWYSHPKDRYLHKNVGTANRPKFARAGAHDGAPYIEQFLPCYMGRQNVVRAVDWNNDGKTDLVSTRERVLVLWFRNLTNQLSPIFATAEEILGKTEGTGRPDICDWNNDGRKDLICANRHGHLNLFLNEGTDAEPRFGQGQRISANGKPIDGTLWTNVMVCDWDNDGKKDAIFGMGGQGNPSEYYDWPHLDENPAQDHGFLFYKNVGTDAEPVLDYPKWVTAGGEVIQYIRPNVGSYVDWDGDGKKDFIACEFENLIRLYKNTGTGAANTEPVFANKEGIAIVAPWTAMLVSGVHVLDWNRDGDLDVVTGQGHGGVSLRFFDRNYIDDFVNETMHGKSTYPKVRILSVVSEPGSPPELPDR